MRTWQRRYGSWMPPATPSADTLRSARFFLPNPAAGNCSRTLFASRRLAGSPRSDTGSWHAIVTVCPAAPPRGGGRAGGFRRGLLRGGGGPPGCAVVHWLYVLSKGRHLPF